MAGKRSTTGPGEQGTAEATAKAVARGLRSQDKAAAAVAAAAAAHAVVTAAQAQLADLDTQIAALDASITEARRRLDTDAKARKQSRAARAKTKASLKRARQAACAADRGAERAQAKLAKTAPPAPPVEPTVGVSGTEDRAADKVRSPVTDSAASAPELDVPAADPAAAPDGSATPTPPVRRHAAAANSRSGRSSTRTNLTSTPVAPRARRPRPTSES